MRKTVWLITIILGTTLNAAESEVAIKGIDGLKIERVKDAYLNALASKPGLLILDAGTALSLENSKIQIHDLKTSKVMGLQPLKAPPTCQHLTSIQEPGRALRGLYCFSGKGRGDALQLYQGRGKFETVLKTPNPITAVTGGHHRIFFLSGDAIYLLREGEKIRPVFVSPFLTGVQSMAFDGDSDILFLATDKEVYSLRAGTLDLLVQGLGGQLSWIKSNLFISNASGVYRLPSVRELLVVKK